jgi:hypothetical protein
MLWIMCLQNHQKGQNNRFSESCYFAIVPKRGEGVESRSHPRTAPLGASSMQIRAQKASAALAAHSGPHLTPWACAENECLSMLLDLRKMRVHLHGQVCRKNNFVSSWTNCPLLTDSHLPTSQSAVNGGNLSHTQNSSSQWRVEKKEVSCWWRRNPSTLPGAGSGCWVPNRHTATGCGQLMPGLDLTDKINVDLSLRVSCVRQCKHSWFFYVEQEDWTKPFLRILSVLETKIGPYKK